MTLEELINGLNSLGFTTGFSFIEENSIAKIIAWENEASQPTEKEIKEAASSGAYAREYSIVQENRRQGYVLTADPLFFGWQRGDNTEQEWLDAVQAVKDANPYPEVAN